MWTTPVVALAATAPAFASSTQRFGITSFTSRDVSTGESAKYRLAITIQNHGTAAVSGFRITFTFDPGYGGVTQGGNVTGWTKVLSGNTITYTRQTGFPLAGGGTLDFTTDVNTGAFSTLNIVATVAAAGWSSQTLNHTRVPIVP